MPGRVVTIVCALVIAAILALLTWPQAAGLARTALFAQAVAFRGPLVLIGVVMLLILVVVLALSRRRFAPAVFVIVVALFVASNATILASRGLGGGTPAATSGETITVLSWNTLGGVVEPETIARLALDSGADVVALPETTDEIATRVAEIMGAGGSPMWSHTISWSDSLYARSTSLLISTNLGDYRVSDEYGSTSVLPSIVATPVNGSGPAIVAVHPVSPTLGEMAAWRADLDWVHALCSSGDDLIAAGDFNATLDHLDLGACSDAANDIGTAALGTWPTRIPAWLSAPIDHVVATSEWRAVSATVIQSEDGAGSDHRPIVATLTRS